jgi:hypothetical protein
MDLYECECDCGVIRGFEKYTNGQPGANVTNCEVIVVIYCTAS